jgi:hypothetical protein
MLCDVSSIPIAITYIASPFCFYLYMRSTCPRVSVLYGYEYSMAADSYASTIIAICALVAAIELQSHITNMFKTRLQLNSLNRLALVCKSK